MGARTSTYDDRSKGLGIFATCLVVAATLSCGKSAPPTPSTPEAPKAEVFGPPSEMIALLPAQAAGVVYAPSIRELDLALTTFGRTLGGRPADAPDVVLNIAEESGISFADIDMWRPCSFVVTLGEDSSLDFAWIVPVLSTKDIAAKVAAESGSSRFAVGDRYAAASMKKPYVRSGVLPKALEGAFLQGLVSARFDVGRFAKILGPAFFDGAENALESNLQLLALKSQESDPIAALKSAITWARAAAVAAGVWDVAFELHGGSLSARCHARVREGSASELASWFTKSDLAALARKHPIDAPMVAGFALDMKKAVELTRKILEFLPERARLSKDAVQTYVDAWNETAKFATGGTLLGAAFGDPVFDATYVLETKDSPALLEALTTAYRLDVVPASSMVMTPQEERKHGSRTVRSWNGRFAVPDSRPSDVALESDELMRKGFNEAAGPDGMRFNVADLSDNAVAFTVGADDASMNRLLDGTAAGSLGSSRALADAIAAEGPDVVVFLRMDMRRVSDGVSKMMKRAGTAAPGLPKANTKGPPIPMTLVVSTIKDGLGLRFECDVAAVARLFSSAK